MKRATRVEELGNHIKEIRLLEGLSQSDLAKKVGIRQDTVSSFERITASTKLSTSENTKRSVWKHSR